MASAGGGGFGDYYGGVYGDIGMEFGDDKGFIYGSATELMNFHRPVVSTGSDSSSTSSSNNGLSASWGIMESQPEAAPEKRRTAGGSGGVGKKSGGAKKPKTEPSATAGSGPLKVRKEKLGDRISALQQLVSPFGKTDTASVLHEAMGYIRFLHDQVQVLSTPYLQNSTPSSQYQHPVGGIVGGVDDESRYDLRSRGLCLVPVECTGTVANSNGADFWAPANMINSRRAG